MEKSILDSQDIKHARRAASEEPTKIVDLRYCPICKGVTCMAHLMKDARSGAQSIWYQCACGVVFQNKFPDQKKVYDQKILDNCQDEKFKRTQAYGAMVYGPIIEEIIYGRKLLEVGYHTPWFLNAMKDRGWIGFGIDDNIDAPENDRFKNGNFEQVEFAEKLKFDLIWMSHVLEHFQDPVKAIEKCKRLLTEDGVLFIATPDTDFIHTRSTAGFGHWKPDEHYIMFNKDSLVRVLQKMDFEIILARRNWVERWTAWDDIHVIAQKKFL